MARSLISAASGLFSNFATRSSRLRRCRISICVSGSISSRSGRSPTSSRCEARKPDSGPSRRARDRAAAIVRRGGADGGRGGPAAGRVGAHRLSPRSAPERRRAPNDGGKSAAPSAHDRRRRKRARSPAELDAQNRERQGVEREIVHAAEEQIAEEDLAEAPPSCSASAAGIPGVLGIVASRIARKYHRPTIIVGFDETGVGKGSGRSIAGLSLVAALGRCAEHAGEIWRARDGRRPHHARGKFPGVRRRLRRRSVAK